MNVEQLQKINMLASELKKHNTDMSTQEAVEQAEEVYIEPSVEAQPTVQVEQTFSQELQTSAQPDLLAQKQFELLLANHTKKYDEQFELYRNAINKLAEELETVKLRVSTIASQQPKERQESLSQQPKLQPKQQPKPESNEPHPKQGKFSSEDVDIQKMFYFGNKR